MRYKNPFPAGVKLPEIVIPKDILDELGLEEGSSNRDILYELSRKGLRERGITELPNKKDYYDRTIMELEIFEELGFIDYILLNWDVLYFCKKQGIPTGAGRGSAAGSLVLYLLGVTNIDPIKYDLFFERFVSRSRAKQIEHDGEVFLDGSLLADVDNDISYNRRSEVIEYIEKKYKGKTSKILTLNTLSGKLCMKECGKIVSELNETEVNQISDSIPKHFGKVVKLKVAYEESESFKKLVDRHPKAFHIAKKLEGLVKNTGVHPSGLSICYYEQSDIMPLQKTNDGSLVSGYDMDDVASLSVKFDILGLRTLSVVNDVCERIGLNVNDIDPHDPLIYTALSDLQKVCQTVAPRNLEQLSAVVAIARPGALDFKDRYANYVKTGESQSVHEFFDSILGYTGGIPLYQEQLMKMAVKVGFSLDESEQLRRIVGKKKVDEMQAWKAKISEKVSQLENADPIIADVLWKVAEDSANYSFNKSHSISYAYLAAITVYLKFKYPQEFFLSLLKFAKFEPDSHDEIAKISQELVNFDIKLLPPDLNNSDIDFKIEGKDIRYGLNSIKGVSEKVLIHLLDFREGSFSNKYQVFSVAKQVGLNIGVLSSLIQAGLLDSFVDSNRSNLVLEAQVFNALTDREKRNFIVLGENYNYDIIKSINDVIANGMIGDDKDIFKHPEDYKCSDSVKMAEPRSEVRYVGVLVDIVKRTSKNGNEYARMEMHDEKGSMNVLFMDGERESRLTDYLNAGKKLPKKDDVVIITGSKGDDIIFANTVNTLKDKIYMKLSQVK
jgi:DNA polymerase III subunit alpha